MPPPVLIPSGVLTRQFDGESVLLNLDSEVYFGLNAVGTFAWEKLRDGQSLDQIAQALTAAYDVSEEEAMADLDALLGELIEHGLVELKDK